MDEDHVARYDGRMDTDANAEIRLLTRHGLGAGSVVIEFGPGTGQFTLKAASVSSQVIAADVSPPCWSTSKTGLPGWG